MGIAEYPAGRVVALALVIAGLGAAASADAAPAEPSQPAATPQTPAAAGEGLRLMHEVQNVTTLRKFRSNLTVGPGVMDSMTDLLAGTIQGRLTLPPAPGYFIAFGFVPNTATVEFEQAGVAGGTVVAGQVDITIPLLIRLKDVKVDGVGLDVGPRCQTAEPTRIRLRGELPILANVDYKYTATYEVPRFSGCGVRENLDPLLTGLASGPDNVLTTTLRLKCAGPACPPKPDGS